MQSKFQTVRMNRFFKEGRTRDCAFRREQLRTFSRALDAYEGRLHAALYADLRKSPVEAFTSETGYVQRDIRYALKNLRRWSRPRRASVPPGLLPARAQVTAEPKGVVLIIGPWNYPVQLVLSPLVAALAAGNCAVIKPSELAPHTSAVLRALIEETFDPAYVCVVEGGRQTAEELLEQPLDHIFFTGGVEIGRAVAQAAATRLIPVTLELGGRSPAIVLEGTDLRVAARRIVRGKFMNAGQTCVAPDHVRVPRPLLSALTAQLQETLRQFYGEDPQRSPDYGRIVNRTHFDRLAALCPDCIRDAADLYIAPTVLSDPPRGSALLREELFGPLLPVIPYDTEEELIAACNAGPAPLALYLFTPDPGRRRRLIAAIPSGGVCVNDTVNQLLPSELPFGGRGASGIGAYHGKRGFEEFSHFRSVLLRSTRFDLTALYPPVKVPLQLIRRTYRFFAG